MKLPWEENTMVVQKSSLNTYQDLFTITVSLNLNLALFKSCHVKEIHIMLGIIFKCSLKGSRLEQAIGDVNSERD